MHSIRDPPTFVTRHRFDELGKWDLTEDLMVPFQQYSFNTFAFAIDPTTNRSVYVSMFGVLDILGDFIIHSHDVGDTNEFTYNSGDGLVTTEVESRLLRVEITPSTVAKAFTICMFLANWVLTVGSVYTTALVAFRRLEANSVVAALPFSTMLAIPTVRSLYINSPPLRISIGKSYAPPFLPFPGLIGCPRRGGVFRAGCDRRVVLPGSVKSPHEWPITVITPNWVHRLDFCRVIVQAGNIG